MSKHNDLTLRRSTTKERIRMLARTYPGIEQRVLPRMLGCSAQYAKDLVDELVRAGQIEKAVDGVTRLRIPGAGIVPESAIVGKRWNECRSYQVPRNQVLKYRDLSISIPENYRVDIEAERHPGIEQDRFLLKLLGGHPIRSYYKTGGKTQKRMTAEAKDALSTLLRKQIIRVEEPSEVRSSHVIYPYDYQKPQPKPQSAVQSGLKVYSPDDADYPGIPQPKSFSPLRPITEPTMEPEIDTYQDRKESVEMAKQSALEKVLAAIAQAEKEAIESSSAVMPSQKGICRLAGVGKAYLSQPGDGPAEGLKAYNEARRRVAQHRISRGRLSPQEAALEVKTSQLIQEAVEEPARLPDVGVVVQLEERIHHLERLLADTTSIAECRGTALEQKESEVEQLRTDNQDLLAIVVDLRNQLQTLGNKVASLQEHKHGASLAELLQQRIALEERTISNCAREADALRAHLQQIESDREAAACNLANWRQLLADLEAGQPCWSRNGHLEVAA